MNGAEEAKYFCVLQIEVEETRLPCLTSLEYANLGFLDPSSQPEDLAEGSKVRRCWPVYSHSFGYAPSPLNSVAHVLLLAD